MRGMRGHAIALLAAFLILAGSALFVGRGAAAPASSPAPGYRLVKKIALGGEGGWDYFSVDPATHRIFIPRQTHMLVLDPDGKVVSDMPNMQGNHAVDFAPELKRGFTSNGGAHSVTFFDLGTLKILKEVPVPGRNPDAIVYDPASKRVFAINGGTGHDVTAIDARTGEVLGSIPLGGKLETAQADGAGRVYVNNEDKNEIAAIDSRTLKVLNTWPIAPCNEPAGLAIDVAHKRLFAGCHNQLIAVVDYTSGKVVATIPIGTGVDANRYDPGTGLVFASCGDGTITVAHEDTPDKYTVVQTIMTQRGARTMALDTKNHNIYTVTAELGPPGPATPEIPRPRPTSVPNTFTFLSFSQ
jgi:DNA-binding beta-propeller fold protein YncE